MAKRSLFEAVVSGIFGRKFYRYVYIVLFGRIEEDLDAGTKNGARMAELALGTISETIQEATKDVGFFSSQKESQERKLTDLQKQLASASRSLEDCVNRYDQLEARGGDRDTLADLESTMRIQANQLARLEDSVEKQSDIVARASEGLRMAKSRLRTAQENEQTLKADLDIAKSEAEMSAALEKLNEVSYESPESADVRKFIEGARRRFGGASATGELLDEAPDQVLSKADRDYKAAAAIDAIRARRSHSLEGGTGVDMTKLPNPQREGLPRDAQ